MYRPTYKDKALHNSVCVVITSHNYGKYIEECISSLFRQTTQPFEVCIIADACNMLDDTASIADSYNIRCIEVNHANVALSRQLGLINTTAPYVIFLDADDTLEPTYIAKCQSILDLNSNVGIVTTGLYTTEPILYEPRNIERQNWVHSGSMVRRVCILDFPIVPITAHEDWWLWKSIVRNGWTIHQIPYALYNYRQHDLSICKTVRSENNYYTIGNLQNEPVTIVIPFCRERYWPRLFKWLTNNVKPHHSLTILDSSDIDKRDLYRDISELNIKSFNHIELDIVGEELADSNRLTNYVNANEVQWTMPRIYSHLRQLSDEYIFILEDDVLPITLDTIDILLKNMGPKVAAVSGIVRSRHNPSRIYAGKTPDDCILDNLQQGVDEVAYTGFGCLLLRRSVILETTPFINDYDVTFCRNALQNGFKWLLDYSVDTIHGGSI